MDMAIPMGVVRHDVKLNLRKSEANAASACCELQRQLTALLSPSHKASVRSAFGPFSSCRLRSVDVVRGRVFALESSGLTRIVCFNSLSVQLVLLVLFVTEVVLPGGAWPLPACVRCMGKRAL